MPIKVLMPALSPTMTEGTLAKWLKQEGDMVEPGDAIAEIETDKATMEVEAVEEGKLGRIVVPAGTEGVPVNQVIALLLEEGEGEADLAQVDLGGEGGSPAVTERPADELLDRSKAASGEPPVAEQGVGRPGEPALPAEPAPPQRAEGERIFASPLAKRMAQDAGLDLGRVQGSGPHGRIVKRDVEAAIAAGPPKPAEKPAEKPAAAKPEAAPAAPPAAAAAAAPAGAGPSAKQLADAFSIPYHEEKPSGMRRTIARRLYESKTSIPHWYLTVDCELDRLMELRRELNARAPEGVKVSVNDLIIKAAALCLRRVPQVNAAWSEEAMIFFDRVDVSVAVATPGGLITPIIKDADRKGLAAISAEMKDLAARARDNKLKPEEFQGGTFCVSNLGMFGAREFSAIINPPQSAILALGKGEQRPVVKDGAIAIATMMSATLSADHRIVDGAVSAEFMSTFKAILEDPVSMML
jgi:pyruvate dehydrogenase E2 component (dihydrolipoamide acetyltransferase)